MTRNDDGNWVCSIRQPNRARGFGIPSPAGQFAIGDRFPVGNFTKMPPDIFLKGSTFRSEGNIKFHQLACEVSEKLADRFFERSRSVVPGWIYLGVPIRKINPPKPVLIRSEQESTDWCIYPGAVHLEQRNSLRLPPPDSRRRA